MPRNTAVISPNLGLYLGRSTLGTPARGLQDGFNFRIDTGQLNNLSLGWQKYSQINFGGPVTLIDTFFIRGIAEKQIIGTDRDLFDYDASSDTATYINARFATGTVMVGGNDTSTKNLLHGDGTDASTTITDSNASGTPHTWTASGNAQVDTAQSKFGGASLLFDGTGDFVSTPDHADYTLGTGAFTVDFWVRPAADGSLLYICGQAHTTLADANSAWYFSRTAGNKVTFNVVSGTTVTTVTGTTNVIAGSWFHVAGVRTGNILRLFINGTQEGGDVAYSSTTNDSTAVLAVGAAGAFASNLFNGWVDEFRFSVGTARWTANFTAPTTAYGSALVVQAQSGSPAWLTNDVKAGDFIYFGSASQNSISVTWYEIASVDGESQLTLVSGPGWTPTTTYTIRRTFTGELTDNWSTATFVAPDDGTGDDLWFATNGVDYVVTWDGSATQVVIRDALAFKAKALAVYKDMMFYLGLDLDAGDFLPTSFVNSDVNKPLEIVSGLAGQFRAHAGVDHIQMAHKIGDNLAIYSQRTLTLIQFIGDPVVFAFRDVTSNVGLLAPRLFANFGDFHEFLHRDSQYLFDGVSVSEIGKQVWREVLSNRDPVRADLGFTHFDEEAGEVHWVIPLGQDAGSGDDTQGAERAYVEHYLEEVGDRVATPFSARSSPWLCGGFGATTGALTWADLTTAWQDLTFRWNDNFLLSAFPISLMGSANGYVYKINNFQTADGVPLVSFVRFGRQALGDGRMRGLLTRVYPFSEEIVGTLDVTCRFADHAEGAVTIIHTEQFDSSLPEGGHFVSPFRRGRYYELEFGTDGTAWSISGYDVDVREGGKR